MPSKSKKAGKALKTDAELRALAERAGATPDLFKIEYDDTCGGIVASLRLPGVWVVGQQETEERDDDAAEAQAIDEAMVNLGAIIDSDPAKAKSIASSVSALRAALMLEKPKPPENKK
jgi:hypothetical protein